MNYLKQTFLFIACCILVVSMSSHAKEHKQPPSRESEQTAEYWFYLAQDYFNAGKYKDTIEALKKVIRLDPQFAKRAETHQIIGSAYLLLEEYQAAADAFEQAIKINPDYANAHYNLGLAYKSLRKYQKAIDAYKQVIRINPDDAEAYCSLGCAYTSLEKYQEAIHSFRNAVRIKPNYADAYYNLGVVYTYLKDRDAALGQYKILKNLNPRQANKLLEEIKRL